MALISHFQPLKKRLPVSTNDNLLSPPNHSYLWHCPIGTLNTGQILINFTKKSKKKILKETLLSSPTYSSHWQLSTIHIHTHMNTVKLNPVEKSSRGFSCHIFCQLLGNAILCGEKSISARWHSLKMAHFWWGRRRGESFSWIYRHFRTWKQRLKEIGTLMHRLFLRRLPSKSNAFEVVQPLQYSNSQLSATLPGRMADEEKWSNWKKKRSSSAFLLCPTL